MNEMHTLLKTIYFVETEPGRDRKSNRQMIIGELELENCQRNAMPTWP